MARWIGIDITATAVRVAVLQTGLRKTAVKALREELVANHESTSAAIRAAMVGIRSDAISTAISGHRSFLRQITLPAAVQKELAHVLSHEVESTLPFELDDAVMDHRILRSDDKSSEIRILAGVAYTHEVRDRINLIRRGTNQEPQRIGLGPLPLCNLAVVTGELAKPGPVAFLDLGDQYTELLVIKHGEPRFSRTLSRGLANLPEEASILARELRQTVSAWRAQGGEALTAIHVVGAGAATPGLEPYLASELGLQLSKLPPLSLELAPADHDKLPRFAKAVALALSHSRRAADLNLRQGALEAQHSYQLVREKTPLLAGLAAAIVVSLGFSAFAEMRALDAERAALEEQLAQTTKRIFGVETRNLDEANKLLDDAISGKSPDPVPEMDAFDVMVELSERVPKDIVHDVAEFDYNRGDVVIQGMVPTIEDGNTISAAMAEHECFHDVKAGRYTKLKSEDRQKYVLEFKVKCDLKKKKKAAAKTDSSAQAKDGTETGAKSSRAAPSNTLKQLPQPEPGGDEPGGDEPGGEQP